jgi:hypothetical protein
MFKTAFPYKGGIVCFEWRVFCKLVNLVRVLKGLVISLNSRMPLVEKPLVLSAAHLAGSIFVCAFK